MGEWQDIDPGMIGPRGNSCSLSALKGCRTLPRSGGKGGNQRPSSCLLPGESGLESTGPWKLGCNSSPYFNRSSWTFFGNAYGCQELIFKISAQFVNVKDLQKLVKKCGV